MPKTLAAYAKANPPKRGGKPCWACGIKERDEIDKARRESVTLSVILDWLRKEKGYPVEEATKGRLEGHFVNMRHHERSE